MKKYLMIAMITICALMLSACAAQKSRDTGTSENGSTGTGDNSNIPVAALCEEPFMLLEKGAKAEVSEIFEKCGLTPKIHFTTGDDYAIMSMVESGLGISILPHLILERVPYKIIAKELDVPAYRNIGLAMRSKETASLAIKRFLDYLQYR